MSLDLAVAYLVAGRTLIIIIDDIAVAYPAVADLAVDYLAVAYLKLVANIVIIGLAIAYCLPCCRLPCPSLSHFCHSLLRVESS